MPLQELSTQRRRERIHGGVCAIQRDRDRVPHKAEPPRNSGYTTKESIDHQVTNDTGPRKEGFDRVPPEAERIKAEPRTNSDRAVGQRVESTELNNCVLTHGSPSIYKQRMPANARYRFVTRRLSELRTSVRNTKGTGHRSERYRSRTEGRECNERHQPP